eukprot:1187895-Prorocentrum_minimum.AAC.2
MSLQRYRAADTCTLSLSCTNPHRDVRWSSRFSTSPPYAIETREAGRSGAPAPPHQRVTETQRTRRTGALRNCNARGGPRSGPTPPNSKRC